MQQTMKYSMILLAFSALTAFGAIDYNTVTIPRAIRVYDFTINMTAPVNTIDTFKVNAYYTALKYAPSLVEYLTSKDTSRNCLMVDGCASTSLYTKAQATANVAMMQWMATNLPHAPTAGALGNIQYYITGSIKSGVDGANNVLSVTYKLSARNGDSISSVSSNIPINLQDTSIVSQAGIDIQSNFGPLFDKFNSYEDKKMKENNGFGVNPTFTLTPAKRVLKLNEETTVKLKLTDMGGALANRTVKVEQCLVGSFDKSEYITDANGEATMKFKADGAQTGTGIIVVSTEYLEPWCGISDQKQTARGQTSITVDAPENSWEISGSMRFNRFTNERTKSQSITTTQSSTSIVSDCQVSYLVKQQALNVQPVGTFVAEPGVISAMYSGSSQENGSDESMTSSEGGYVHNEGNFRAWTSASPTGGANHEGITVNRKKFGFSFIKLTGKRSGESNDVQTMFMVGMATPEVTNSTVKVDSSGGFNWAVEGVTCDTTYTISSSDENSSTVTSISQKCSWDDSSSFTLSYSKRITHVSQTALAGVSGRSRSVAMYAIEITMFKHNGNSPVKRPYQFMSEEKLSGGVQKGVLNVYDMLGHKLTGITSTLQTGKTQSPSGVYLIQEKTSTSQRIKPVLLVR